MCVCCVPCVALAAVVWCAGKKVVNGERTLDVYIERGMPDGHTIEFENQADEHPNKAGAPLSLSLSISISIYLRCLF